MKEVEDQEGVDDNLSHGEERLKGVSQLRAISKKLAEDDETSERNRAKVQDVRDNKSPLNKAMLARSGQKGRFNINFGNLATAIHEASSAYIDGFESPEHLVPIKLNRGVVDDTKKTEYERIMSDEYTKLVRGWDSGFFNYSLLVDQFLLQGVGIGYFEDKYTWQWQGAGLREFKFPRKTKASSDHIEMACCEGQIGRAKLSSITNDPEAAELLGWNVKAIELAIKSGDQDELYDDDNYEDLQEKAKANDFDDEGGSFNPINVIHAWVKENDGSVSYYIATREAKSLPEDYEGEVEDIKDDYLYKQLNAYDNFGQAMQIFPYSTGTKGNIYTIRAIGFDLYPQVMAKNVIQSAELDIVRDSMSVKYNAPAEREINSMPFVHAGPVTFVPPHMSIMKDQVAPDLSRTSAPAIDRLDQQLASKSASSSMSSVFHNKQDRRSSLEVGSALEHFNSLNDGARLLFSRPLRALLSESCVRAFADVIDDETEYGQMALAMQKACLDQGVPNEMFSEIDVHETKTSIPVGAGSKAARSAEFEAGATLYQEMDDVGRENFNKDRAIHGFGVQNAKRYLNFESKPREIIDVKFAKLENNDLMDGQWVDVSNSEVHIVHLREHIAPMEQAIESVEVGEMELLDFTNKMELLYSHAMDTIQRTVVPDEQSDELNMYEQKMQQIGEYLNNGIREREKMEREAAEEEATMNAQGEAVDPAEEAKAQVEQMKLQVKEMEAKIAIERKQIENQLDAEKKSREIAHIDMLHQQKLVQNQEESLQKMKLADAETASKIGRS